MVVPENPNNQPPEVDPKSAEVTKSFQDAVQRGPQVGSNDLKNVFSGQEDVSNVLHNRVAIGEGNADGSIINPVVDEALKSGSDAKDPIVGEALNTYKNIAKITTTDELEKALSVQKSTIVAMESRVQGTTSARGLAEDKQQADKMLEANTYFANFA